MATNADDLLSKYGQPKQQKPQGNGENPRVNAAVEAICKAVENMPPQEALLVVMKILSGEFFPHHPRKRGRPARVPAGDLKFLANSPKLRLLMGMKLEELINKVEGASPPAAPKKSVKKTEASAEVDDTNEEEEQPKRKKRNKGKKQDESNQEKPEKKGPLSKLEKDLKECGNSTFRPLILTEMVKQGEVTWTLIKRAMNTESITKLMPVNFDWQALLDLAHKVSEANTSEAEETPTPPNGTEPQTKDPYPDLNV